MRWLAPTLSSRSTTRKCVGGSIHGAWSKWRTLNTATSSHYEICSSGEREREGERGRGRERVRRMLLYSGKFSREKIFTNFAILQLPAKVFSTKF